MILAHALHQRFHRINLPGALLIALLQRMPVLQVATAGEEMVISSPVGAVLKSVVAAVAALGAVNSLAGATPLVPSSGTVAGISVAAGTAVSVLYTVSGTPSSPGSWSITGSVPPGLNFSGLTAPGTVNIATLKLTGTPTTAGTYALTLQAFESPGGKGNKSPIYSYSIMVTGGAASTPPSFTTQPTSQTVTVGASVTFTAAATGSPTPTYQWQKGAANIAGATSASYTIASAAAGDAGTYAAIATNSAGSATSTAATLTVNSAPTTATAPAITTQPTSQTVTVGASVTFTAAASGSPTPTYQWQKGAANIAGATSASYTIASAATGDAGTYAVIAANSAGSATSAAATLTVNPAPDNPIGNTLLQFPVSIARDSAGDLFVADASSNTIRKITSGGMVTTLAGLSGVAGSRDGVGSGALFSQPGALTTDNAGNVYIADTGNATIRRIMPDGTVSTLAGSSASRGNQDGVGNGASFNVPSGIAIDDAGNLYVTDAFNATIRKVTAGGAVSTLAGSAMNRGEADGTGSAAQFNYPNGVAVDSAGILYVADTYNDTIREVTAGGMVTTLAGSAGIVGANDGTGINALFNQPYDIAVDGAGNVYVADTANATIRRITPAGAVTTVAGVAGISGFRDGAGPNALFNQPRGLVIDASGNLFVADTGNAAIREISGNATVTTLALTAGPPISSAPVPTPAGSDASGNTATASHQSGGGALEPWLVGALALLALTRWVASKDGSGRSGRRQLPPESSAEIIPV
jgi:sugar lactone lactonase YvrE